MLAVCLIIVPSCAKDRTLQEYRDEKVAQELAKIKAVAGGYSGVLYSRKTGGPLGPVYVDIEPDTTIGNSTDNLYQEQHVGIKSVVTFIGQGMGLLSFNGAYDSTNTSFKLVTTLKTRRGTPQEMELAGAFGNDQLTGEIEATGYPTEAGYFTLVRGSAENIQPGPGAEGSQGEDPPVQVFEGNSQPVEDTSTDLKLVVITHQIGSDQAFLDNFLPVKTVDLTLNFAGGLAQVFFKNAVWDLQRGILEGQSQGSSNPSEPGGGSNYELDLSCHQRAVILKDNTKAMGWFCQYVSDRRGLIFSTILKPTKDKSAPVTDPFFAPPPPAAPAPQPSPSPAPQPGGYIS